jgi:hypothetical protein
MAERRGGLKRAFHGGRRRRYFRRHRRRFRRLQEDAMAKGQQRSTKEQKKKKSVDKKDKIPRYLRASAPGAIGKATAVTEQKK